MDILNYYKEKSVEEKIINIHFSTTILDNNISLDIPLNLSTVLPEGNSNDLFTKVEKSSDDTVLLKFNDRH